MKFISAEEFLKQPIEVQKMFWEYLEGSFGVYKFNNGLAEITEFGVLDNDGNIAPLLTEGQLRQFIGDKTNCFIELIFGISGYVVVFINKENIKEEKRISVLEHDLLQAYWKVALEIAKEC